MKTNLITRILLFALVGFVVGAAAGHSAELSIEGTRALAFSGAVVCQYLHFVSVPLGVASFIAPTTLKGAREQRAKLGNEMRALLKKVEDEKRNFNDDERAEFDRLNTEFDQVQAAFEELEKREKVNLRIAATLAGGEGREGGPEGGREFSENDMKDLSKFSLLRGLRLISEGKPLDGVEAEVHEIAKRDAAANGITIQGFAVPAGLNTRGQTVTGKTTNDGDQGGVTVPTELNGLIEAVWKSTFLSQVGARMLTGLQGNQEFMVQETVPTIQELTEIEEMADDEILFSKFQMAPKRRGTTVPVSKQTLLQSSLNIQQLLIENFSIALGQKLNAESIAAILAAITTANGNLHALGENGAAPTYADVVELEGLIDIFETNLNSPKYLTNTNVRKKLKLTEMFEGTNGKPVWEKGNMVNDYPAVVSNIVPSNLTKGTSSGKCSAIVFGDFSYFYVGMWGGADFIIDPYSAKKKGQIEITVNQFWDTKVARAKSFAGIKDALT